jgi:hypothetical protein
MHPNCRHALSAFIPGPDQAPDRPTADPEGDQQRQQQRYLERQIRDAKRKVAAAEPFGDTQELRMAQALRAAAAAEHAGLPGGDGAEAAHLPGAARGPLTHRGASWRVSQSAEPREPT